MHDKNIIESLKFWGPMNAVGVVEKLAMRGVDLDVSFVANRLHKLAEGKRISLGHEIGGSTEKSLRLYKL
jgi:hypothetical protein